MFYCILLLLLTFTFGYKQPNFKKLPLKYLKHSPKKEKVYEVENHPSYTIPNWVYKSVFKYNKPNKYNT